MVVIGPALAEEPEEIQRRLLQRLILWTAPAPYAPRGAAVQHLLARVLALPEAPRAICGAAARETVLPLTWEAHLGAWLQLLARA